MISKGCRLRLKAAFTRRRGAEPERISTGEAEYAFKRLIEYVRGRVSIELDYAHILANKRALDRLDGKRLKPAEAARQAGIRISGIPGTILSRSRVEKLITEQIAGKIGKWNGDPRLKPNAGYSINLGAVDRQMAMLTVRGDEAWLSCNAYDKRLLLCFNIPRHLRHASKVCLPSVTWRPSTGRVSFSFAFQYGAPLPAISSEYVLGVDRGIREFATFSVTRTRDGSVVCAGTLSTRLHQLSARISRMEHEVKCLHPLIDACIDRRDLLRYHVLMGQLTGKRRRLTALRALLCKESAMEIVAVAQHYGNCMIMLEDLSWSGNWHSRVPFGLFKSWLEFTAVKAGTHVQLVNAAYTSRECANCGETSDYTLNPGTREFECHQCAARLDRDVNAAINIARRGITRAVKSFVTRGKHTSTPRDRRVLRRTIKLDIIMPVQGTESPHRVTPGPAHRAPAMSTAHHDQGILRHRLYYYTT